MPDYFGQGAIEGRELCRAPASCTAEQAVAMPSGSRHHSYEASKHVIEVREVREVREVSKYTE
jgi:hypothetical protein